MAEAVPAGTTQFLGKTGSSAIPIDEEEGRDYVRALWRKGKLDQIAKLWISGAEIDWRSLYGDQRPRRINAPGYSFARTQHWFTDAARAKSSDHPPPTSKGSNRIQLRHRPAPRPRTKSEELKLALIPGGTKVPQGEVNNTEWSAGSSGLAEARESIRSQLAKVLFQDEAAIDDNRPFVELGLDSILAVELVRFLNRRYAINIRASQLFDCPTVATLAALVADSAGAGGAAASPQPVEPKALGRQEEIRARIALSVSEVRQ
ncbi:phosphopantetheine-binding protein [Mycobacterium sp.]|uniref:acyl carrier protein n=1 Tax=Mycobacterium sp. TaxID=1785 RepID=UPI003BA96DE0